MKEKINKEEIEIKIRKEFERELRDLQIHFYAYDTAVIFEFQEIEKMKKLELRLNISEPQSSEASFLLPEPIKALLVKIIKRLAEEVGIYVYFNYSEDLILAISPLTVEMAGFGMQVTDNYLAWMVIREISFKSRTIEHINIKDGIAVCSDTEGKKYKLSLKDNMYWVWI